MKYLVSSLLGLALLFPLWCQGQTITVTGTSHGAYSQTVPNFVNVCEGDNITLEVTGGCTATATQIDWYYDGLLQASGVATTSPIPGSFSVGNITLYTVELTCPSGDETVNIFLGMASNPNPSITVAEAVCEPGGALSAGSATSTFTGQCGTCDAGNNSKWDWVFSDGTNSFPLADAGQSFPKSHGDFSGGGLDMAVATLTANLTATDVWGCQWNAPAVPVSIVEAPFTAFVVTPDPMTIGATGSPVDLAAPGILSGGAGITSFTTSIDGIVYGASTSGRYYHLINPGTESITFTAEKEGCVYALTDDFTVNASTDISYQNHTTASATSSWEACVGDIVEFTYTGAITTPTHLRLAKQGGGYVVVELAACASPCTVLPSGTPTIPATLAANYVMASAQGGIDASAQKIRFAIPNNAYTGNVTFFAGNPADGLTAAANVASITNPSILTVNNPQVGFAIAKDPMCYSDKAALIAVPSGGTFTAAQAEIDLANAPTTYAAAGAYTTTAALIDNTTTPGTTYLDGSAIATTPATNDGGQMVQITYTYTPKYTDGATSCPQNIVVTDVLPVFDNRGVSFSFPLVSYDPAATPINLNTNIQNVIPAPNAGTATLPPAANSWINAPTDYDFWGTFVQDNTTDYTFLTALAGVGTFTINLEMDNNGCAIESQGEINTLPEPEFDGLPSAMCRSAGIVEFRRDANYSYNTHRDTLQSCISPITIDPGPIGLSLRPIVETTITPNNNNNNGKDTLPGINNGYWVSSGAENLFNQLPPPMQIRPIFLVCKDVTVVDEERFEFYEMNIYDSDPSSGTANIIQTLSSTGSVTPNSPPGRSIDIANGVLSFNTGSEIFEFDASHNTLTSLSSVFIELVLVTNTTYTPIESTTAVPYTYGSPSTVISSVSIIQQVELKDITNITIDSLPGTFCYNAPSINVQSTPAFEPGFSTFRVRNIVTGDVDTLVQNLLDISLLFGSNTTNQHYQINYIYTKFFGCDTITTETFDIIAPQPVAFAGANIGAGTNICINATEELFYATPPPTAGLGGTFSGDGVGVDNQGDTTINNMFSPAQAGLGNVDITYAFTDPYGCISEVTRTLNVRNTPNVSLATSNGDVSFCSYVTNAVLMGSPDTSITPGAAHYFGTTIIGDNIFHPSLLYAIDSAIAVGGVNVYYSFTDTFGCKGTDTLSLSVQPIPIPQITGINNEYCENAPLVTSLSANDATGIPSDVEFFYGNGIITGTDNYSPSQAGAGPDTLYLVIENIHGCRDTSFKEIIINAVPIPVIDNLDADYCVNESSFNLSGTPNPQTNPGTTGIFSGVGILINGSNYNFSPQLAASQAGLGSHIITYTFTDANGCVGVESDTTIIRALPTATFDLDASYCVDAPDEYLAATIISDTLSSALFSGWGIVDAVAGQLNFLTAANANGYGLHQITLTFADTFGCTNSTVDYYLLNALPTANIAGLNNGYCTNNGTINLQGFPSATVGGTGAPTSNFIHNFGAAFGLTSAQNAQAAITSSSVSPGAYAISYAYVDGNGCKDTVTTSVEFFAPPNPNITNLAIKYCETEDTFNLMATPLGGEFSGAGTQQSTDFFMPFRAGPGTHNITYTVTETNALTLASGTVSCTASDIQATTVYALPVPFIDTPDDNAQFCENDAPVDIVASTTNPSLLVDSFSVYHGTGVAYNLVPTVIFLPPFGYVTINDTVYHFDPALAGPGSHDVTFIATNVHGCQDSVTNTYVVFPMPQPAFALPATFCESDAAYPLAGSPSPGTFYRNGVAMGTSVYVPNPNYPTVLLTAPQHDTLVYSVSNAQCTNSDTQYVTVNPVPHISYVGMNDTDTTYRACIGADTLHMYPNILGGSFSGSGVLFGTNTFLPSIAGTGEHLVHYTYTDTTTNCANTYTDTFFTYNTPHIELSSTGNCGDTLIVFTVDTANLNVFGTYQGNLYDNFSTVFWNLGDGTTRNETALTGNIIDTIYHLYSQAGAYFVSLYAENHGFCSDSDTLRIIVSPAAMPTPALPYLEDFEASSGGWLEESEYGAMSSALWEWGVADGNRINTVGDDHNNVWITHKNAAYGLDESGWVYSPCFDLRQLERPMISLDYFSDTDFGNDGAVIEYFHSASQEWLPLGNVDRGVNWYNKDVIAGRPGLQDLAPFGWSGEENDWKNARYRLDDFQNYEEFRFRVAFGAVGVHNRGLEGFAFDNVWIGDRSRNVLLEHFASVDFPSMNAINNHIYDVVFHTNAVKDVVLVQYQTDYNFDEFNDQNPDDANTRELYYGVSAPANSVVNGQHYFSSVSIAETDFEWQMLQTPKFNIEIDNFDIDLGSNLLSADVLITANEDMPQTEYIVQMVVLEDSLNYTETLFPTQIQSTMRVMLPDGAAGTPYNQAFAAGEQISLSSAWQYDPANHKPQQLELAVFIQNLNTKEVFQAICSRDITVFVNALGTNNIAQTQTDANEVKSMNLYPNPAQEQFMVSFEQPLSKDYDWRLVDLRGVILQQGNASAGTQQIPVYTYDYPAGMYFFVMGNNQFYAQRKVVITR